MNLSKRDIDRFWSKVNIRSENECWEWIPYSPKNKYQKFSLGDRMEPIHRVSFFLKNGFLEEDIHHRCHNKGCCNPNHLVAITHSEHTKITNSERSPESWLVGDKHIWKKHPELIPRGEEHPMAKLNWNKVRKIRALHKQGMSCRSIAKLFDISSVQTNNIVNNRQWIE